MAERRTRRRFTREFKAQAVKRLLDGGKGLSEVATELGMSTGQLSGWRTSTWRPARRRRWPSARRSRRSAAAEARGEAARGGGRDPQQGGGFFRQGDRVTKFAFVAAERANHAVATLCRVIGASVSGFYAWLRAIPTVQSRPRRKPSCAADRPHLRRPPAGLRLATGPRRAAPGGLAAFAPARRAADARDGALGPPGPPPYTPRTTDSRHDLPVAPNLLDRGTSPRTGRTRSGWPTSPTSRPTRAGCTGRDQGHGHARDRRLVHGRPPQGRAVHRRPGHGHPAASAGSPGWSTTATAACNTHPSPTAGAGAARHHAIHEPPRQLPR
jgi:hypothetical protein